MTACDPPDPSPRVVGSSPTGPTNVQVRDLSTTANTAEASCMTNVVTDADAHLSSSALGSGSDRSGLYASSAARLPALLARRPR